MLRTFYIQIEEDSKKIRDICDVSANGYIEVQLNTPLPSNICGGCYKWENDSVIYVEAWDINLKQLEDKISILETENADLLLDSAIKDIKIQTIEKDLADLTLEVVMGGM